MYKREQFLKSPNATEKKIIDFIEPILELEKCELIAMQLFNLKSKPLLRLYLDKISLNEIVSISRNISTALDVGNAEFNWFDKSYQLELSSPGLNRPLTKKSHFLAAIGKNIQIKTNIKKIQGVLENMNYEHGLTITGHELDIGWADILDANILSSYPGR